MKKRMKTYIVMISWLCGREELLRSLRHVPVEILVWKKNRRGQVLPIAMNDIADQLLSELSVLRFEIILISTARLPQLHFGIIFVESSI